MHEQQEQRERRLPPLVPSARAKSGVVAVVAGDGNRRLFETLAEPVGAIRIVVGGQTANPSTAELLAAIEGSTPTRRSSCRTTRTSGSPPSTQSRRRSGVPSSSPTDSIPAGLAALVAFDGTRSAAENAAEMAYAVGGRRHGRSDARLA